MGVGIPNVWKGLFGQECHDFLVDEGDNCFILLRLFTYLRGIHQTQYSPNGLNYSTIKNVLSRLSCQICWVSSTLCFKRLMQKDKLCLSFVCFLTTPTEC